MALLTVDERKAIFKELGLGAYNKTNIKKLQKKYMLRKSDVDGIYGQDTDNLLRTVYYTTIYTKDFEPEEFRCECGGRYCCGFPSYMKPAELIHIQKIRDHYGKPITITCGLRDKRYNASLGGSVQNSLHLTGQALDFYQQGVTDTLANRKKSIKWIKKQPNHHYTYGNGINSSGYSVYAPYMGNALHTDTYDNVKPKHPKLTSDTNTQKPQKKPSTSNQKPSATTSNKTKYKVIDVSVWQGYIDWKKVKADGVIGAIIRYADGASIDTRFEENMKSAKANGLHVGSYIFSRAKTKAQAQREATRIFNACKKYAPDMPLYIDLEASGLEKYADTVASAFLNKIKALGGKGGVYANLNWWNNYLTKTAENYTASPFWIAQYNDKITYKKPSIFGMWQYSSSGKVKGISGKVDMDWCYKAYWNDKPKPEPTPKPTEKTWVDKANAWAIKTAKEEPQYHYNRWKESDAKTHTCPICNKRKYDDHYGWNCIGWSFAIWHHGGGIPCYCNCHVIADAKRILDAKTDKAAYDEAVKRVGVKELKVIRDGGKSIKDKLKAGDICWTMSGGKIQHTWYYMGNGKYSDSTSGRKDNIKANMTASKTLLDKTVLAIRYTGK